MKLSDLPLGRIITLREPLKKIKSVDFFHTRGVGQPQINISKKCGFSRGRGGGSWVQLPELYCLGYQNIYPGKGGNVKGGPD